MFSFKENFRAYSGRRLYFQLPAVITVFILTMCFAFYFNNKTEAGAEAQAMMTPTPTPVLYPGDLDTGFDGDGIAITKYDNSSANAPDEAQDIAIQSDGKIVVVGHTSFGGIIQFLVLRYNTDGSLDTSFDSDGKVITSFTDQLGPGADDCQYFGKSAAIQSDGKIVVGGDLSTGAFCPSDPGVAIARYNTDGSLDTSFGGGDGKLVKNDDPDLLTSFGDLALMRDSNVNPSGRKIVVSGTKDDGYFGIITFGNTGGLSCTFAPSGSECINTFIHSGPNNAGPSTSVLTYEVVDGEDSNWYIVAAGHMAETFSSDQDFFAARYVENNGVISQDGSFGCGSPPGCAGYTMVNFTNPVDNDNHADLEPEITREPATNKLILTGDSHEQGGPSTQSFGTARLNQNGTLDTSFSGDGKVLSHFERGLTKVPGCVISLSTRCRSEGVAVTLQSDNKIVAVGATDGPGALDLTASIRLNTNGTVDKGFGWNGRRSHPLVTSYSRLLAVAVNSSGDIFAAGRAQTGSTNGTFDVVVLKYKGGSFNRPGVNNDADDDGKSDLHLFRYSPSGSSLNWLTTYSRGSTPYSAANYEAWGTTGDLPTPMDYDGDSILDLAVFRPSSGEWYIIESNKLTNSSYTLVSFGTSGDKPIVGDYDGDGRDDLAYYRDSNNTFYIQRSTAGSYSAAYGTTGDKPVVGDFNGDGSNDLAYFRPSNGTWYWQPIGGSSSSFAFGSSGDIPAPADYDGDGTTDFAVFRPSTGIYYIQRSTDGFYAVSWGTSGDIPIPNDYDGDHRADIAVWRAQSSNSPWYILNIYTNNIIIPTWGSTTFNDFPLPAAYIYY